MRLCWICRDVSSDSAVLPAGCCLVTGVFSASWCLNARRFTTQPITALSLVCSQHRFSSEEKETKHRVTNDQHDKPVNHFFGYYFYQFGTWPTITWMSCAKNVEKLWDTQVGQLSLTYCVVCTNIIQICCTLNINPKVSKDMKPFRLKCE